MRLDDGNSAVDFNRLSERGLLSPCNERSLRVMIPSLAVIGAHLVAQGWYLFHFVPNAPHHKSPFRVIVDLGLLGTHTRGALAGEIHDFVKHEVPAKEFFGLVELVGHLANGNLENMSEQANIVLKHAMAALLNDDYRHSLLLNRQREAIRREGIASWGRRLLARTFAPNPEDLDRRVRSGKARSNWIARLQITWEMAATAVRGVGARLTRR